MGIEDDAERVHGGDPVVKSAVALAWKIVGVEDAEPFPNVGPLDAPRVEAGARAVIGLKDDD